MARIKKKYIFAVTPTFDKVTGKPKVGYSAVFVGRINPDKITELAPWAAIAGYRHFGQISGQLFLSDNLPPLGMKETKWPNKHYIVLNEVIINFISQPEVTDVTDKIKEWGNANDFKDFYLVSCVNKDGKHCVAKFPDDARVKLLMHFIANGAQSDVFYRRVTTPEEKKYNIAFAINLKRAYFVSKSFMDNYYLKGDNIWQKYINEQEKIN